MNIWRIRSIALVLAILLGACTRTIAPLEETTRPGEAEVASRPATSTTTPTEAPAVGTPTTEPETDLSNVRFSTAGWQTDFTKHSVPLSEISSGGPPRDGIPPIDEPKFESVTQADGWLAPKEPVIHVAIGNDVRAYPLQILVWHEIVNDEVHGVPVAVTFCPLCNTAITFDRRLGDQTLDFGTTGNLRHSDLVMWDRQTESWWQQITGEAIVGELTGQRLEMLPATIISWEEFRQQFPNGRVLSRDTGSSRSYGRNPYVGYDQVDQPPFLFEGELDGRLPPKERVVTVSVGGEDVAYSFSVLTEQRVIADHVGGQPIVVFFQPGTTSALDAASIAASRDVGATGVYQPDIDGRPLTFTWQDDAFVDAETGSRWTLLGEAVDGPLAGKQLTPIVHGTHFWFAWAAFKPETRIYNPS
jgi:hypothetical protein